MKPQRQPTVAIVAAAAITIVVAASEDKCYEVEWSEVNAGVLLETYLFRLKGFKA